MKLTSQILFLIVFCSTSLLGQNTIEPKPQDFNAILGVVYNNEKFLEFKLQNTGYSIGYTKGQIKTYYKTRYFNVELGRIKHKKEIKQGVRYQNSVSVLRSVNSFVYGKQNSLFVLRAGLGNKRYFSEKEKRKGLVVGINYQIGPTLGLLKPYFLQLDRTGSDIGTEDGYYSYNEETAEDFLDLQKIKGPAPFTKGIFQSKVSPGIHFKAGAHFAPGAFDKYVRAIEAGVTTDLFIRNIPIMVGNINRPFFVNLYVSLQFGKRS